LPPIPAAAPGVSICLMSRQDPPYKLVLERSATFQHYYLMEVYPPAPLTVTRQMPVLMIVTGSSRHLAPLTYPSIFKRTTRKLILRSN
ncbi:hypothetical protein, partial [Pseudoflavonifractor phocaeensis]|uniref:hypothetical protein n=1 Tax=Pseudoflavonifractor phocaeensis TaxID=1870988 RepID=UPI001958117E